MVTLRVNGVLFTWVSLVNWLFILDFDVSKNMFLNISFVACDNVLESLTWQARLGLIGKDRMARLAREEMLGPLR